MKAFKYGAGQVKTMTIAELRGKLNEYPQDMPVLASWEGVITPFRSAPEHFDVVPYYGTDPNEKCDCLIINVDQY